MPAALGLSEADVKAFIERWQSAQNGRDFEAYSRSYAERFMGLKRVGAYSKRFDRAGWLADRKPMFDAGARVSVSDVQLVAAAGVTRATFTQAFSSGTFRDVGKKELFLVATPGGISITKEEMLDSQVSEQPSATESVLAFHRDGVVVERGFDKRKLKGEPRLREAAATDPIGIAYQVSPEVLSPAARAWLGREVTVYTASGKSCTGKVARFEVRVQAVPHSGMRQEWNGEFDAPKASPAQIASTIENMAQNEEHFVVGVLDHACAGSWSTAAPASAFTPARAAEGALRQAAVAAFKALPAYAQLQKQFVQESKVTDRGWEADGKLLRVMELRVPNQPALLLVTARTDGGCSEFSGSLSALWQLEGPANAPKLSLLAPSFSAYVTLRGALDLGDAGLALLAGPDDFDDELSVLRVSPRVSRRVLLSVAVWECLC
ncbi:MAG TPA: hypothetical protein VEQ58_14830 [Polyangiaceae bacterium]|nr:hypothetical protein [Polyangiaceae bacterium]